MVKFVQSNYKKMIITIIILDIKIKSSLIKRKLLNYIFDFIIEAGRITGTLIRVIGSGSTCII